MLKNQIWQENKKREKWKNYLKINSVEFMEFVFSMSGAKEPFLGTNKFHLALEELLTDPV